MISLKIRKIGAVLFPEIQRRGAVPFPKVHKRGTVSKDPHERRADVFKDKIGGTRLSIVVQFCGQDGQSQVYRRHDA